MKYPKPKRREKDSTVRNRLDRLTREVVRLRDRFCVICGSMEGLEASHYLGRRNYGVRWDLFNVHLMCKKCHNLHHDGKPVYIKYMMDTYGAWILEEMYRRQNKWRVMTKGEKNERKREIEKELKELLDA